ncbi:MAG TPA: GNAT family N-acetyltransferase [Desulfobacteraceae bacterium]|nr:GNAT family N-acetyltransferase [Desulfobacteraceae bacterium]
MAYHWQAKRFDELTTRELYDLLRLRTDVFVVEQSCPYPELDGKDDHPETIHLWHAGEDGRVAACARLLAPGVSYGGVSMGRVAVHNTYRGIGLAHAMVDKAIELAGRAWPGKKIEIGAQEYLTAFYKYHGFRVVSAPYLEDNIPHIDMVLNQT